jgi:hypothetical protein
MLAAFALAASLQAQPMLIPVIVQPNLSIVQRSLNGSVSARQGQMSEADEAAVLDALTQIQSLTSGRVIFKTVIDPTELYFALDARTTPAINSGGSLDLVLPRQRGLSPFDEYLLGSASPRFMSDPPESAAYLILHGGATGWSESRTLAGKPLIVAPFHHLAGADPSKRLAPALAQLLSQVPAVAEALPQQEAPAEASPFAEAEGGWSADRPILAGALPLWSGAASLTAESALSLTASWTEGEPLALRLRFTAGEEAYVRLQGALPRPLEMAARVAFVAPAVSGEPLRLSLAPFAGRQLASIALTAGPYAGWQPRQSPEALRFSLISPPALDNGPGMPLVIEEETVIQPDIDSFSVDARLTALDRLPAEPAVPTVLETKARGLNGAEAFWAAQILSQRTGPESDALLDAMIRRGPLSVNRDSAARAAISRPALLPALRVLAFARSWPARAATAEALGTSRAPAFGLALAAMTDDPEPAVRMQVALSAQLDMPEVLPRLLYMTANDTSSWVRAAAALRLMAEPDGPARQEAVRAVRDADPFVRRTLLTQMMNGRAEDRSALRLAVLDPLPELRALALRAFAKQPGPVVLGEIEQALKDEHPAVKEALAELAKAKGLTLPPPAMGQRSALP